MKPTFFRIASAATALCLLSPLPARTAFAAFAAAPALPAESPADSIPTYRRYRADADTFAGTAEIRIPAASCLPGDFAPEILRQDGEDAVVLSEGDGALQYRFRVPAEGLYRIGARYDFFAEDTGTEIGLAFEIDGSRPFEEADSVYLPKNFEPESEIRTDDDGNEIRPKLNPAPGMRRFRFVDRSGLNPDPFEIRLSEGSHTLTVRVTGDRALFAEFFLEPAQEPPPYAQVLREYREKGLREAAGPVRELRAEEAHRRSDSFLYAQSDRSDAAVSPKDPVKTVLNVIPLQKFGSSLSWEITVPETGLYRLGFHVLQDQKRGLPVTLRLSVDGAVPFKEAGALEFPYSLSWYNYIPGGDDPYLFYFEAGKVHTVTLECTTGRFAETLRVVRDALTDLNRISRKLTMVVGMTPDLFRDYDFDTEIPELKDDLTVLRDMLQAELKRLHGIFRTRGSELSEIENMIRRLDQFVKDPRSIPSLLSTFRTETGSLGTWMLDMTGRGVTLDTVAVLPAGAEMPRAETSLFEQLRFGIQAVIGSFRHDYAAFGAGVADRRITVWIASGRDQANTVHRMLRNDFTPKRGIAVNLSVVADSNVLLQAALAGQGPDTVLFAEESLPVNLAARGALWDLSRFEGFDRIASRFYDSAFMPYRFEGGVYAVPNALSFCVLFARTDILGELGVEIPDTWEELYRLLPVVQRNNLRVGLLGDRALMFETLILQNGGDFFRPDLSATRFDEKPVLDAFKTWTGFYREYGLPVAYDAFSYFRTGVMPLMVAEYTLYNQLTVGAPEIKGLWTIAPLPGTRRADGTVNRAESCEGTASPVFKSAENPEDVLAFLDWWTDTPTQTEYAEELEAAMGPAARHNSANPEAVANLPWRKAELACIQNQWKWVTDIPVLPSTYYVARNVANAFRAVVYDKANERETLNKYGEIIDKEIARKNAELAMRRKGKERLS